MAMRFNEAVREWKSLPLTAGDIGDLDRLRPPGPGRAALAELSGSPLDGEVAEPDLLHAVFAVGLRVDADPRAWGDPGALVDDRVPDDRAPADIDAVQEHGALDLGVGVHPHPR